MNQSQPLTRTSNVNRYKNRRLVKKLNETVNQITRKTQAIQQNDTPLTYYSKSMLLSAISTPKIKSLKQSKIQIQKISSNLDSLFLKNYTPKNSKSIKTHRYAKSNAFDENLNTPTNKKSNDVYSQSMDYNFFMNQSSKDQNQFFMTMQGSIKSASVPRKSKQLQQNQIQGPVAIISKNKLKTNHKWTLQQFLFNLYHQKTKYLKTKAILKQQQIFMQRSKQKFNFFDNQELQKLTKAKFQNKLVIKQINGASSDFSVNSIRCICEFILSNKISKGIRTINHSYLIKIIILDKNPLGDEGISILAQSISFFKDLQKLSLASVGISPSSAKQLLTSLIGLQHLKYVNFCSTQGLNRNRFGQSFHQLQKILNHPFCVLQELNLSSVNLGQNGINILSNGMTKQSKIKYLSLGQNDINSKQIPFFMTKFKVTQLKYLNLSSNMIGDDGLKIISQIIGSHYGYNIISRNLQILNVSNNQIRSYGIQSFSKNMLNNQALIQLNLSNNNLCKGQRFLHFRYFIAKNWILKKIHLQNCFNNSDDLRHLFEGLQQNRVIEELYISKNNITVQTFGYLAKALATNKGLKKIDLQSCNLGDKHFIAFQKDLKQIKNLEDINLNNNYLTDKCGKILLQTLNICKSITKASFIKNCLGIKTQNEIVYIINSNKNRKQQSKKDQKQIQYLNYVAQIQTNHQQTIKSTIQKLQQKQQRMKYTSLVCECVKVELEQDEKKKQLKQELLRIKQLEQKLKKNQVNKLL